MADRGSVTQPARAGRVPVPARVRVAGVDKPALTIAGASTPPVGADVVTVPLSDGSCLILGRWSQ